MKNAAAIIAGSVLLSTGAAFALMNFVDPEPNPSAPLLEALQGDLAAMRRSMESQNQRLAGLEAQVESASLTASRATVPEISDAQLERVLARLMEAGAGIPVEAMADPAGEELDLQSVFTSLQGSNPDENTEVWKQVVESGRMEDLIALFEENARANTNLAQAQLDLGNAYLQQLMSMTPGPQSGVVATKADEAFDAALEIDPEHWSARFTKAVSLTFWPDFLGKKKEAIEQLQILVGQQEQRPSQPHFAQTYLYLGNLYEQQGDPDKAREAWENGLAHFPDDPELKARIR